MMNQVELDIVGEHTVTREEYRGIKEIATLLKEHTKSDWLLCHTILLAIDFRIPVHRLPLGDDLDTAIDVATTIDRVKELVRLNKVDVQLTSASSVILSSWNLNTFNRDLYDNMQPLLSRIVVANPSPYNITVVEQMNYLLEIICLHLYGDKYSPVNYNLGLNSGISNYLDILEKNKVVANNANYCNDLLGVVCQFITNELF